MTEFLRRSDAPHKSIRCYRLLSATVKSCSCWRSRALLQVMARICHQTSAVHGPGGWHCQVLSGGEICLSGLEGTSLREQLRWRQSYSLLCVSELQLTFLVMLLHFSESPDKTLMWKVTEQGSVAQRACGAGMWLGECQSTGCVLRALGHDTALCSVQSPYLELFAWVKLKYILLCCISP